MANSVSVEVVAAKIFEIRGKKVMLDRDLATLYGVPVRVLNQAVKRNLKRFPPDFMYHLTRQEVVDLKSQFVTSSWGGVRKLPYVFTQEGVAMLSSVLNSDRAIKVNIQIMRAFVQLRKMLITNADLRRKIEQMEKKYDKQFAIVFDAISELLEPPKETRAIGFYI
jgi:hypothetical protein